MNYEIIKTGEFKDSYIIEKYAIRRKWLFFNFYYSNSDNIINKRNYSLSLMYAIFASVGVYVSLLYIWFLFPLPIGFFLSYISEKANCTKFNRLSEAETIKDNLIKRYLINDVVVNKTSLKNNVLEIKNYSNEI